MAWGRTLTSKTSWYSSITHCSLLLSGNSSSKSISARSGWFCSVASTSRSESSAKKNGVWLSVSSKWGSTTESAPGVGWGVWGAAPGLWEFLGWLIVYFDSDKGIRCAIVFSCRWSRSCLLLRTERAKMPGALLARGFGWRYWEGSRSAREAALSASSLAASRVQWSLSLGWPGWVLKQLPGLSCLSQRRWELYHSPRLPMFLLWRGRLGQDSLYITFPSVACSTFPSLPRPFASDRRFERPQRRDTPSTDGPSPRSCCMWVEVVRKWQTWRWLLA